MAHQTPLLMAPLMHSAPTGPIALGNLIKDPRSPEIPLTKNDSDAVRKVADKYSEVEQSNVFRHDRKTASGSAGVVAKFFESLALDLGGNKNKSFQSTWKINRLVTRSIYPSEVEVKSVFNEPSVQEGIRNSFFRANVYMITSVQIAYGAEDFISTLRGHGAHLHAVADLNATGLPVNAGIDSSFDAADGIVRKSTFNPSMPFILAYGLREIYYRRKRVAKQKVYRNGDLYNVGGREPEPEEDSVAELRFLAEDNSEIPSMWGMKPSQYILEDD
ncbi:hypothetical protein ISF_03042 [Cordyceps fumosorosea ARSEF 2679]|uniref:Uncharacterized protein n=1 Tax=Cordyceps fumosorosea (strain ARSEF 2679) TaxID=1081104 RepID=A0A162JJ35_CORFA|nr:hypothetical protein ISF_03042 [Cordyceps fumosorosea ARSEF 2679]OAA69772.1 hypothetical protein ISF_03042 [Cordyceps fumosorosea ARSEF 2679]